MAMVQKANRNMRVTSWDGLSHGRTRELRESLAAESQRSWGRRSLVTKPNREFQQRVPRSVFLLPFPA
jgi:hypothetical protein